MERGTAAAAIKSSQVSSLGREGNTGANRDDAEGHHLLRLYLQFDQTLKSGWSCPSQHHRSTLCNLAEASVLGRLSSNWREEKGEERRRRRRLFGEFAKRKWRSHQKSPKVAARPLARFEGRTRAEAASLRSSAFSILQPGGAEEYSRQRERQTDRQGGIEGRLRKSSCLKCLRKFNLLENREDKLQTHSYVYV